MDKFLQKIRAQIQNKRLSHAYIIFGPVTEGPLLEIFEVSEADVLRLNENPIKIGHIRELGRWIQLKPHSSEKKVALIFQAENMTLESANALLKILEEPPAGSVLFLQVFKKERVLPTILSRCQTFKVSSASPAILPEEYLSPEEIAKKSIKDKFNYADQLASSENIGEILNRWELYFREKMLKGEGGAEILKSILLSKDLLLTNSSVKLLLENLLLEF